MKPTILYSGKWISVFARDRWAFATRRQEPVEILPLDVGDGAQIAATHNGKLVVLREFRLPLNRWIWSLPAGLIESGEDPKNTAIREFQEETGLSLTVDSISAPLATSAGLSDETIIMVFGQASGEISKTPGVDEHEKIEVHLLDQASLQAILKSPGENGFCARAWLIFHSLSLTGHYAGLKII
jgi:ADP-ribose pyrophosphatase